MLSPDVLKNIKTISIDFTTHSVWAHGILMSVAFVILFPLAALTIRIFKFKGLIWVHAALQLFAFSIALAAFGLGVATAAWQERLGDAHPVIGMMVISLLFLQPLLGLSHHYVYVRSQRRTFWAQAHTWFGRGLIVLGVINGGLGLQLAGNTRKGEIAYGVIAGVVLVIYVGIISIGDRRSREGGVEKETPELSTEKSSSTQAESQSPSQVA